MSASILESCPQMPTETFLLVGVTAVGTIERVFVIDVTREPAQMAADVIAAAHPVPPMVRGRRNPALPAPAPRRPFRPRDRAGSRLIRYRLVLAVADANQPLTVTELAALVGAEPKVVSDLLRAARGHGHVTRLGHGLYGGGHLPAGTASSMRHRLAHAHRADG
jgi:hypothetical protein